MFLKLFLFQLLFVGEIFTWRLFHMGRGRDGLLGRPPILPTVPKNYTNVAEQWYTQTFDHFNPTDTRTWQQRYFVNPNFFNNNTDEPVVFLLIGGEGSISVDWMVQGSWIDYAKYFGALYFQLEHRFYGKSIPTEDLSVQNLRYLTSEQALADIAQFIAHKTSELGLPSGVKWVTFGGSYSGGLSAWARQKYPHLIHAAVASSPVMLAKVNVLEYTEVVVAAITAYNPLCTANFQKAFDDIYTLLSTKEGQARLNTLFKLCDDISENNSMNDVGNFFTTLIANIAYIVQYNHDNRFSANPALTNFTIEPMCDIMLDKNLTEPIERLAEINSRFMNIFNAPCTDYKYENFLEGYRNESISSAVGVGRQWFYQTCVEFGFVQSTDYVPQIFGHSLTLEFGAQQCIDIFGSEFNLKFMDDAVKATNINYGGLDSQVTKTIFTVGALDPWNALQIWKPANPGSVSIVIDASYHGGAHCSDMYPPSPKDPPQLTAARIRILGYLEYFLQSD